MQKKSVLSINKILVDNDTDQFASYKSFGRKDWHDYELMERDAVRQGPGEGGEPVVIESDELKKLRVCFLNSYFKFMIMEWEYGKSNMQVQ